MANTAKSNVPSLSSEIGTASATAGAATCNAQHGIITSEALTTAAGADYTLTLTNNFIGTGSNVIAQAANGTNSTSFVLAHGILPAAGSCTIKVRNMHASAALNGTVKIRFLVL